MLENKIMLITYPDSIGENLNDLHTILNKYFKEAVGGVHILPFYPSSADRGFAPMTYREVDPQFGDWQDIEALATDYYLMFDYMVNHISRSSKYFQDYIENKEDSKYKDLFINFDEFWPGNGPSEAQIDMIYKRKPKAPYTEVEFADGSTEKIWSTFDEEQIDINNYNPFTRQWNKSNLEFLINKGASVIRLDAFAYATKKVGTNCFFVEPDIWELLDYYDEVITDKDAVLLPEIHEHYTMQLKVAKHGYYVYDFALPMLLLHAIYTGRSDRLLHWFDICPRKQFTTLDTHDGIGVVDVADLLTDAEIEDTVDKLYSQGGSVKRIYSSTAYKNLDIYQINCTYYSALGENDKAYLLARAIQFFAPGIPQVYYVGMLAGANDEELVNQTKVGRDINRHFYSKAEIDAEVKRPVVSKLIGLMEFRNSHPAFNGEFSFETGENNGEFALIWRAGEEYAKLDVNLSALEFNISCS